MAIEIDYYITMISKNNELVNLKGSSKNLSAHWEGGARTRKEINAAANREGMAEGGCGGNSAMPERNQTEASPAALLGKSRAKQNILFLLEEKTGRAHIRKSEECFAWRRALASGGGALHFRFRFLDLCIRFGKMISKVCEGFNSGAKKLDTNSDFEDERVRSPSPAIGWASLRFARATPSLWREMKRILMLSGEINFFFLRINNTNL